MANLDRSLDDMIKMNQSSRGGARSFGPRPTRRTPNRTANRAAPYSSTAVRAPETQWDHGTFVEATPAFFPQAGARFSAIETGTKLLVSNLDHGVIDDDLKELFSAFGNLKRCSLNYDRNGRSEGTAEVVFSRRQDAEEAIKSYNNVQLDGKPMKIEIIGAGMAPRPLLPTPSHFGFRYNGSGPVRNAPFQGRGGGGRRPRHGGVGDMRNGGREKISAEDLDAELDKYHAKKQRKLLIS